ncbi:MAG: hypothetical protein ACWGOX_07515 [Desulforhopalus sp.]
MASNDKTSPGRYTCNEYREEMVLLALRQQLKRADLSDKERTALLEEIDRLEQEFGF